MIKKLGRKGFTLVELLVTIILLGIIGAIVIYNMTGVTTNSKEKEYERFVSSVKSAASVYADLNPDAFADLYVNKAYIYITAEDLIKNGLIAEDLTNPYTEKVIGSNEEIKANLDNNTGSLIFEYPIENRETETFLVTISDYVVWGEPYDCMQGAGTYELALSEENGDLIMLDSEENISKYHFECSMPKDFKNYVDKDTGKVVGKSIDVSGNYEITYSWITSSGTRKTTTRVLKVLPKVIPTFKTNYEYNFKEENTEEWYTPSYNEETKKWTYLTYVPHIEGADPETTVFRVSKRSNDPYGELVYLTNDYIKEYKHEPVDDGDKTYYIETIVSGHHYKKYSYKAEGQANMKSKLIIPSALIAGASTDWAINREFALSDTYSPVGVAKYEFRLSVDETTIGSDIPVDNTKLFNRITDVTIKDVTVLTDKCENTATTYKYIFFRAINKDGFVGDWAPYTNAYLTNQVDYLIQTDSKNCTNYEKCCLPTNSGSCYYGNKVKYLSFGGRLFVVLERYSNNKLLVAYSGVGNNRVTPTSIKSGHWSIKTCDGTFSKSYWYSSPVLQVIIDEGQNFLYNIPKTYKSFLEFTSWPAGYNAYVGNIDYNMFTRYGKALHDSNPYWTTTMYSSPFTIHVDSPFAHGDSTTKYNTYFYSIDKTELSTRYAGSNAYVKPILKFKTIYTCGGDGSKENPYVIAI